MSDNDSVTDQFRSNVPFLGYFSGIIDFKVSKQLSKLLHIFGITKGGMYDPILVQKMRENKNEERESVLNDLCKEFIMDNPADAYDKLTFGGLHPESGPYWNALRILKTFGITGGENAYLIDGVHGSQETITTETLSTPGVPIQVIYCCLWLRDMEFNDSVGINEIVEYGRAAYKGVKDEIKIEKPKVNGFTGHSGKYYAWRQSFNNTLNACGLSIVASSRVQATLRKTQNAFLHSVLDTALSGGFMHYIVKGVKDADGYAALKALDDHFLQDAMIKQTVKGIHTEIKNLSCPKMVNFSDFVNKFQLLKIRLEFVMAVISNNGLTVTVDPVPDWKECFADKVSSVDDIGTYIIQKGKEAPDLSSMISIIKCELLETKPEFRKHEMIGGITPAKGSSEKSKGTSAKKSGSDEQDNLLDGLNSVNRRTVVPSPSKEKKRKSHGGKSSSKKAKVDAKAAALARPDGE